MCQRLNTGESNNFYFGIFICIGPLKDVINLFLSFFSVLDKFTHHLETKHFYFGS